MPFLQQGKERIYYIVEPATEEKKPETIVMLHNNITDHSLFDPVVPLLNKRFTIIRYDLRGFGKSDLGEQEVSYGLYIKDLQFVIKALKLQSFHLVGIGFSALIAAKYATRNDKKMNKLILLSMPCHPPNTIEKVREHRRNISHSGETIPIDYITRVGALLPTDHPSIKKWVSIIKRTTPHFYYKIMDLSVSGTPLDDLTHIQSPTLILSGKQDRLFPQHYLISHLQDLPHCHYISIPNSSNMVVLDKPESTAMLIADFINEKTSVQPLPDERLAAIYDEVRAYSTTGQQTVSEKKVYPHTIEANLMTAFYVVLNDKPIVSGWNMRSAKSIFIYLLFHQTVTRDQLCEALWPEIPIRQAKKNLTVYLSYLKKLLSAVEQREPVLITDREHIHLNATIKCDALTLLTELQHILFETDTERKFVLTQDLLSRLITISSPAIYDDWFVNFINWVETKLIALILWVADVLYEKGNRSNALVHLKSFYTFFNKDEQIKEKIEELRHGKQNIL
ncbi:hypothetical protein GCM10011391_01250 [Pullulanibacillus camelliae]|uniref:AB hydrolase-1 domain-containing protein n=1 Tax=Pullulanibacillus camelliae TaxID=1707096 RepID=A0A8J2VDN1_9BACL|nr:alpha/beta hydrolase [Pullulanibacillus camelliae]GGE26675.1 hypothetical protein GCM10011391_01250 [Pullulanibacillus camelliae]